MQKNSFKISFPPNLGRLQQLIGKMPHSKALPSQPWAFCNEKPIHPTCCLHNADIAAKDSAIVLLRYSCAAMLILCSSAPLCFSTWLPLSCFASRLRTLGRPCCSCPIVRVQSFCATVVLHAAFVLLLPFYTTLALLMEACMLHSLIGVASGPRSKRVAIVLGS